MATIAFTPSQEAGSGPTDPNTYGDLPSIPQTNQYSASARRSMRFLCSRRASQRPGSDPDPFSAPAKAPTMAPIPVVSQSPYARRMFRYTTHT
jgi:hypothetical protein